MSQGLPSRERVRRRPEFERIYTSGGRVHGRFMTLFAMPNGTTRLRFGVAATRKIGSAVDRNRAKRLARELFRQHKIADGFDIVIVPRREMLDAPFSSLESDYIALFERRARARPAGEPRPGPRRGRGRGPRPASRV
ncbi:MAG: ribonuclease P protein component [Vicinamibacterales bacterium]